MRARRSLWFAEALKTLAEPPRYAKLGARRDFAESRMRTDRDTITFRIPRVRGEFAPRFDRGTGGFERALELAPVGSFHAKSHEKWAGTHAFHPARRLCRCLHHQGHSSEIQPDRSQSAILVMVPRGLVQTEHVPIERRNSRHVARTEGQMMEARIHGTF
jgi:hypothetical protein